MTAIIEIPVDPTQAALNAAVETVTDNFREFGEAARKGAAAFARLVEELAIVEVEDERCDFSWLYVSQCGHCLGHVADWEEPRKQAPVIER